jgi:hypothetical protein
MTNSSVRPDFLKETYPHYRSLGYSLEWFGADTVKITWNYGYEKHDLFTIDELCDLLDSRLDLLKALDKFVYSNYRLDALEASRYGTLEFRNGLWIISSKRPDGSIEQSFLNAFSDEEIKKLHHTWDKELRPHDFKVNSESLMVELESKQESLFSTHALHSEKTLVRVLRDSYDLSEASCFLINHDPTGNVLIGHKDAMERLIEIPGSNYSLKTYQEIRNELWSKNVTK